MAPSKKAAKKTAKDASGSKNVDHTRSIFLTTTVSRDSFNQLFPQIQTLKSQSALPIYLHIDSLGGQTYFAERLYDLLTCPRSDGKCCPFIAVAPQIAASAAADLLIQSDHAIVEADAKIHCHGTRIGHSTITEEEIEKIDNSLKLSNRVHTMRLSRRVAMRLCQRLLWFNSGAQIPRLQANDYPEKDEKGLIFKNAEEYLKWVKPELSEAGRRIVDRAFEAFKGWLEPSFEALQEGLKGRVKELFEGLIETYNFECDEGSMENFAATLYKKLSKHHGYDLYSGIASRNSDFQSISNLHLSDAPRSLATVEVD